jgi:hypothetical protein
MPSGKTTLVGMSFYRNAIFHLQNKLKQEFTELVGNQLEGVAPVKGQFRLSIDLYYKNSVCDASNIAAVIEKVTLDTLQEFNIIENDNVKFHLGSCYTVKGQDKVNPRAEITITQGDIC